MKKYNVFYYLLLILSCIAAVYLAGAGNLYEITITLCYVCVALFAMVNIFVERLHFLHSAKIVVKISFIVICFVVIFYATHISPAKVFEHELKNPAALFDISNVSINSKAGGYMVDISFKTPHEQLLKIVDKAGLHPVDKQKNNPLDDDGFRRLQNILPVPAGHLIAPQILYFRAEGKNHSYKRMLYDENTQVAYYEHFIGNEGD